jgi:hypothetical protein
MCRVGQNHIYTVYIRYFCRKIVKYTVIYVCIRFWPILLTRPAPKLNSKGSHVKRSHVKGSHIKGSHVKGSQPKGLNPSLPALMFTALLMHYIAVDVKITYPH